MQTRKQKPHSDVGNKNQKWYLCDLGKLRRNFFGKRFFHSSHIIWFIFRQSTDITVTNMYTVQVAVNSKIFHATIHRPGVKQAISSRARRPSGADFTQPSSFSSFFLPLFKILLPWERSECKTFRSMRVLLPHTLAFGGLKYNSIMINTKHGRVHDSTFPFLFPCSSLWPALSAPNTQSTTVAYRLARPEAPKSQKAVGPSSDDLSISTRSQTHTRREPALPSFLQAPERPATLPSVPNEQ